MNIGIVSALVSALLFGVSTPLAKVLVGDISPWLLAGLLYLGSGVGLTIVRSFRPHQKTALTVTEWGWLGCSIVCGGGIGPILLMWGLTMTPGSVASLLLNAEGVLTALLAWFVFHENFDRRIAVGMVAIVAGALVLSWSGSDAIDTIWGPAAILGACLCWALDNNFTRKVSLHDPVQIAALKGLIAGAVNTGLAVSLHSAFPLLPSILSAMSLGFFGYGVSLVLFVIGLRYLGSARAGAYFSVAPFVGAVVAVFLLDESVTAKLVISGLLMSFGVWLHLTERHEHDHTHAPLEHDHFHSHDEHHAHLHDGSVEGDHSHPHQHSPITHSHPHYPDSHHRHGH